MESSSISTESKLFWLLSSTECNADPVLSQYWLWCPVIAPFLGAQAAAALYELILNEEDPLTRNSPE
jgi:hypothetical protein